MLALESWTTLGPTANQLQLRKDSLECCSMLTLVCNSARAALWLHRTGLAMRSRQTAVPSRPSAFHTPRRRLSRRLPLGRFHAGSGAELRVPHLGDLGWPGWTGGRTVCLSCLYRFALRSGPQDRTRSCRPTTSRALLDATLAGCDASLNGDSKDGESQKLQGMRRREMRARHQNK